MRGLLALTMLVSGLIFINIAGAVPAQASNSTASNGTILMLSGFPDTRQSTEYSCGAASFQSVLAYYGRDISEENLRALLFTTSDSGTYPDDLVKAGTELGFNSTMKENLTLEDLEASLRDEVPVMVDVQAWRSASQINESWLDDYDNGHWVVVIGVDDKNVYFEDPYLLGSRGFMSRQEFEQRWHNSRGLSSSDTVKQIHLGVFIRGKPAQTGQFRHID